MNSVPTPLARTAWLFSRRQDLLLLGFPLSLTACGILVAAWLDVAQAGDVKRQMLWISQFIVGNSTHVVLTFVLLVVRKDVLHATPEQARLTLTGSAVAFAIAFCMFWLTRRELPLLLPMGTAVAICFATHHTLSQVRGFWSLYSLRVRHAGGNHVGKMESLLFRWFVPLGLILILVRWFFVPGSDSAATAFFPVIAGEPAALPYFAWVLLLSVWLTFSGLLLAAMRPLSQEPTGRAKLAYVSTHLLAVGLSLAEPVWGAVLAGALHGIEYILLCARMMGRADASELGLSDRLVVPIIVLSMLPLFLIGLTAAPFVAPETRAAHNFSFDLALILLNSLVIAHYFADACIYRFRIPEVRTVALRRLRIA